MCLRRRFKGVKDFSVNAGAKELILDLEERCCIRQLTLHIGMNSSTGTYQTRVIIKIDEDEILNKNLSEIYVMFSAYKTSADSNRPVQTLLYDNTNKNYAYIFLDLGRVERRFALFIENKDTSNPAIVHAGVVYDILED